MRYRTCRITLLLLFIISLISGFNYVLSDQNRTWSFEFENLSISDALSEISHESGIEILLKGETTETAITKSYKHFTLDEVLMDMFRDQSFMALFNYSDQTLSSINIWVMPKADGMIKNVSTINTNPDKYNINRKSFNNQGQIQKIEYTPDSSRSINEIKPDSNKTVNNKNKSRLSSPVRQSSGSINKSGRLTPDNQDISSDQEELIDADDNLDNDSPSDQKQFGGLEPPPMPPVMIEE